MDNLFTLNFHPRWFLQRKRWGQFVCGLIIGSYIAKPFHTDTPYPKFQIRSAFFLEIKASLSSTLAAITRVLAISLNKKPMWRKSQNGATSISSLKKVSENVENHSGKKISQIASSDGMSAQFRSCFVFQLLAGTLFPDKSISWY